MLFANRIKSSLWSSKRRARKIALHRAIDHTLQPLESRRLYSVTAASSGGVLTVTGDDHANAITVSRDATGNLLVNNGAVSITGTAPTVGNTNLINIFGLNGNDALTIDETGGALPKAGLYGGGQRDTLTGGSGEDTLVGGGGNDQLFGKAGKDLVSGGSGNDTLTGGTGDDQAFGTSGNDLMIWNPGEGSDLNEGGSGIDTVEVNGAPANEVFTAVPDGTRVRFDRVSPGPFFIDIGSSENLVVNGKDGNDSFTGAKGLAPLINISVDGGAGNDTLNGGDGNDTLVGGDGNDFIDGNGGADLAQLGAGDDTFQWDPGDGSDIVEGQAGADTMIFNGAGGPENFDLSANKNRFRLFRAAGNITMDVDDVETVDLNTLGGADSVTVHSLGATDVTKVNVNLEGTPGSGTGDNAIDNVIVRGTSADDSINVNGSAGNASVTGLFSTVNITGAEPADRLTVKASTGDDHVNASALQANSIGFIAEGGSGDDALTGGAGNDTLLGGKGDDVLTGGPGTDSLNGGPGDDLLNQ